MTWTRPTGGLMLTGLSQDMLIESGGLSTAGLTVASKRLHFAFGTNNTGGRTATAAGPETHPRYLAAPPGAML